MLIELFLLAATVLVVVGFLVMLVHVVNKGTVFDFMFEIDRYCYELEEKQARDNELKKRFFSDKNFADFWEMLELPETNE